MCLPRLLSEALNVCMFVAGARRHETRPDQGPGEETDGTREGGRGERAGQRADERRGRGGEAAAVAARRRQRAAARRDRVSCPPPRRRSDRFLLFPLEFCDFQ